MDENEITEAATQLELDRLVPAHYDMWRGVGANPKALHEHIHWFPYPRTLVSIRIGDRLNVSRDGMISEHTSASG